MNNNFRDSLPKREDNSSVLEYAISLMLVAITVIFASGCFGGCLTYILGPIVLGAILALVLPIFGIQVAFWQAALGVLVVRILIRFFLKK